ncbi:MULTISPECIES: nickel-dependent lactate racemase [Paenibacillus]|uniref:Uncharacterized protein n=1 Tax=Paenibacillus naphthalenovorans TaxID=162209 RepID=A0A0U2VM86_9BACL|nr:MULTISPECIES: nickel-dependent lactate racemase [Paenibacillus]ALS24403.1 hypothetical protein IJ22_40950 [Paenibacillus naphthalenovorans]GCL74696.1 DUF2088 domain-containing protein [Paenibacillus naphthalenovorans]
MEIIFKSLHSDAIPPISKEGKVIPSLRYGTRTVSFEIPPACSYETITYMQEQPCAGRDRSLHLIREALKAPIDSPGLRELAAGYSRAVILVSDGTRLCPTPLLLEPLLEELRSAGIQDDGIDIIVALGVHRKHTEEELRELVGEAVYQRIRVYNHSALPEDCVHVGTTSHGTPVEINRRVVEAPLRIATGNIEPHALVGVSGGVKALIPGVASQSCIEHNHGLSLQYRAAIGDPDNPIHRDLEEAHAFVPIHFLLNVIVDMDRHVLDAVAGNVHSAHRTGAALASARFLHPVRKRYDLVIVSPGGDPKDRQLYQAVKALRNAAAFTKPGGPILMAAELSEGLGNGMFQYWVETISDRPRMTAKLKQHFVLGAHKILHVDEVLNSHPVYLHSSLPRHMTELLGFHPADHLETVLKDLSKTSPLELAVMPFGSLTFPGQPRPQA